VPQTFAHDRVTNMLQKMILEIENSKTKFSKNEIRDPDPKPETPLLAGEKTICEICGGENFWLAKKSDAWQCLACSPPRSQSLVAQTKPARTIEQEPECDAEWPEWVNTRQSQSYGPLIVCHPFPICLCGSEITDEVWDFFGAVKFCRACGEPAIFDEFVGVEFAKPILRNGWRNR
jgi:hypothetical protein